MVLNVLSMDIERLDISVMVQGVTKHCKWMVSAFDESVFYLRDTLNYLRGMITVHVDDAGISSEKVVIDQFVAQATLRFGPVKRQLGKFLHVGHDYVRHVLTEGIAYTDSQHTYIEDQKKEVIKHKLTEKLGSEGVTALRSINGTIQHAGQSRPEKLGKLAKLQESVAATAESTWASVREANTVLEEIQANNRECALWYGALGEVPKPEGRHEGWQLLCITDSAFKNTGSRHSQGAYTLVLVERVAGRLGGRLHVLEFASRKSKRIAKSTWSAELHALLFGVERMERVAGWLQEVWHGPTGDRGLARLNKKSEATFVDCIAVVDCRGLWESVTSPAVGSLVDVSMQVYLLAVRETFMSGFLNGLAWIPTDDMLSDPLTKDMEDHLWRVVYSQGMWVSSEAVVCMRKSDGGRSTETLRPYLFWLTQSDEVEWDDESYDRVELLGEITGYLSERVMEWHLSVVSV